MNQQWKECFYAIKQAESDRSHPSLSQK